MNAAFAPRRFVAPAIVALMIGGALWTYWTKHGAVEAADRVAEVRHDIEQERIALSLLKAEWGELTQPARLQELVARYPEVLALAPFGTDRMVRINDIPFPPSHDFIAGMLMVDGAPR